eukprot:TRINITY_DN12646_c3_g1_i1.p1 TRINITY_DN12646_c3_g1~~TRINITY_DN12646_c3_g1_i1.p1  ORF type:complete len:175 (+),score=16.38 TRINITY_DN12646_c3_g1_i1:65-589(+)
MSDSNATIIVEQCSNSDSEWKTVASGAIAAAAAMFALNIILYVFFKRAKTAQAKIRAAERPLRHRTTSRASMASERAETRSNGDSNNVDNALRHLGSMLDTMESPALSTPSSTPASMRHRGSSSGAPYTASTPEAQPLNFMPREQPHGFTLGSATPGAIVSRVDLDDVGSASES